MGFRPIKALVLRYLWLYTRSIPRVIEVFFWPVMDLIVWGLVTKYLLSGPFQIPRAIQFLIGAMIFWDILYRAQQGVTVSFLEDVWSRNLINLFGSPITLTQFLIATCIVGLIRIICTVLVLASLAFLLYSFDIFKIGTFILPFFANLLLMGWALGTFTTGLIIRWGQGAEALAWAVPFLIQPFCVVFYPLSVLPPWMQPISKIIPATYVFEGMRSILSEQQFIYSDLIKAFSLNIIYCTLSIIFLTLMFKVAKEKGLLAKLGTQ